MITTADLRRNDPLPPVPAGRYECWQTARHLSIVRVVRPTWDRFGEVTQVWPPVQTKEQQQ